MTSQTDTELRLAAAAALRALGRSASYQDRADAGRGLAALAELPEAQQPLLDLVLDPDDTYVTRVTVRALLRRNDRAGLTIVASALAVADDNHADWIHTAVHDVLSIFATDRDDALRLCERIAQGDDDRVARGAGALRAILADIDPVLRPA
ncbi:hypothetical protein [Kitasatospora terrestris]|uniref:HEAT repeat domain-containing protein n=1 Tax=Kitasatospora terrestris TaxID=258051 RepID=A0ABP9D7Y5_9ACTN